MSACRFYVRNEDGSLKGDETCPIDTDTVERLEKDFTVLGRRKTFVVEFDPPLVIPPAAEEAALGNGRGHGHSEDTM